MTDEICKRCEVKKATNYLQVMGDWLCDECLKWTTKFFKEKANMQFTLVAKEGGMSHNEIKKRWLNR